MEKPIYSSFTIVEELEQLGESWYQAFSEDAELAERLGVFSVSLYWV